LPQRTTRALLEMSLVLVLAVASAATVPGAAGPDHSLEPRDKNERAAEASVTETLFSCKHGSKKFFLSKCQCDAGWEGWKCDVPSTCPPPDGSICPLSKLHRKEAKCSDQGKDGPITVGTAEMGLPLSMQGVFWLSNQSTSSSLMSFATSKDGGGLSKLVMDNEPFQQRIRVSGDRVWSFSTDKTSLPLVEAADLIYNFEFMQEGGETRATSASEIAGAKISGTVARLGISIPNNFALDFRSVLITDPKEKGNYNSSVVYGRPSYVFGSQVAYYRLIQVIDGKGIKLQPAYDDWLKFCNSKQSGGGAFMNSLIGSPGRMWYHSVD